MTTHIIHTTDIIILRSAIYIHIYVLEDHKPLVDETHNYFMVCILSTSLPGPLSASCLID